jgi:hypothetical protein
MGENVVRCPGCGVRLRVPAEDVGRCPKCGTTVRVHDPAEKVEDPDLKRLLSQVKIVERVEPREPPPQDEPLEVLPADPDQVPVQKPPRQRKRRRSRKPRDEGWDNPQLVLVLGAAGCLAGVAVAFLLPFLVWGTKGFPEPQAFQDWVGKYVVIIGMGVMGVAFTAHGLVGVVNREVTGVHRAGWFYWETYHKGSQAVWVGLGQCIGGSIITGIALYGLLIHG